MWWLVRNRGLGSVTVGSGCVVGCTGSCDGVPQVGDGMMGAGGGDLRVRGGDGQAGGVAGRMVRFGDVGARGPDHRCGLAKVMVGEGREVGSLSASIAGEVSVTRHGVVEGTDVHDIILDTGCSHTDPPGPGPS